MQSYLHKIDLFILWYISLSVCAIQNLKALLNSIGISVYYIYDKICIKILCYVKELD